MLSEKTIKVLEENDVYIYERDRCHSKYYREIEFWSPEGEDVICTIWYDGTDEGFVEAFEDCANDFDADQHAAELIEIRGKRGVPESIRDLINDAEWIKQNLLKITKKLKGLDMNDYICTISITDYEQIEKSEFLIKAKTFEEAIEYIKTSLDIC